MPFTSLIETLCWVPLPHGLPWWPAIILDDTSPDLPPAASAFARELREKRGRDAKDALVFLLAMEGDKDRYAVVPKASLRAWQSNVASLAGGVVSSGKAWGRPCAPHAAMQLQRALKALDQIHTAVNQRGVEARKVEAVGGHEGRLPVVAASAFAAVAQQHQQVVVPVQAVVKRQKHMALLPAFSMSAVPVTPNTFAVEEGKELLKLKKELASVRRKIFNKSHRSADLMQEATQPGALSNVPIPPPTAVEQATTSTTQMLPVEPSPAPTVTSKLLFVWEFCTLFSAELNLLSTRKPFATLQTFMACVADSESPLFAQIASSMANCVSIPRGQDAEDRWDFSQNSLRAKVGGKSSPLTWECLWDRLVEQEIVDRPVDETDKIQILESLARACMQTLGIRQELSYRLIDMANFKMSLDNDAPLLPDVSIEQRPSEKRFSHEYETAQSVEEVEAWNEALRAGGADEGYHPETGFVIWRSLEMCSGIHREDVLLAQRHCILRYMYASSRVRSLPLGRDAQGRRLFSLYSDMEEDVCRVWAKDESNDTWFKYEGVELVSKLAESVPEKDTAISLRLVVLSKRRHLRPSGVLEHRTARRLGWRFSGSEYCGKTVRKFDTERGVRDGVVCAWRVAGQHKWFKIVFRGQDWNTGLDMSEQELLHVLKTSHLPLGDFRLSPAQIPPSFVAEDPPTRMVVVPCPTSRAISLGTIVAFKEPVSDSSNDQPVVLVLADGLEFVFLGGKQAIGAALVAATLNSPTTPTRFSPLTHHSGNMVGFPGLLQLWGQVVADDLVKFRELMLQSEEMFAARGLRTWPSDEVRSIWRAAVQTNTQVNTTALALECLLDCASRAAKVQSIAPLDVQQPPMGLLFDGIGVMRNPMTMMQQHPGMVQILPSSSPVQMLPSSPVSSSIAFTSIDVKPESQDVDFPNNSSTEAAQ